MGGDSSSNFTQGGVVGNTFGINAPNDGSFRLGANLSKQTQNSVVVVDEEANERVRLDQNSGMRRSDVSMRQGATANQKPVNQNASNVTGDTVFKQANASASVHGQRSN